MMTPSDKEVPCTIHGWYMPDGKTAANKKCSVEGCAGWAAYHLCNEHAIPGVVVEVGCGNTVVISNWLVSRAGRKRIIVLNDYTLGALFGGRKAFEDQVLKQGYTIHGLFSSEAELDAAVQRHPELRMTPWLLTLPVNEDELPPQLEDQT